MLDRESASVGRREEDPTPKPQPQSFFLKELATSKVATSGPRKQCNKQGKPRHDKAKDKRDENVSANRELSRTNSEGMTCFIENVQDSIATYLTKTWSARTPNSDMKAGLRKTSAHENLN